VVRELKGTKDRGNGPYAVVVSRFNELVTSRLLAGAIEALRSRGCAEETITVAHVPGAMEIPLAALKLAETGIYRGVICLGCVIRGETPHFEYVSDSVSRGVSTVGLDVGIPVTFGVLTTDTLEQALERAGGKGGNKGSEAALAALEMADLLSTIESTNHSIPEP